MATLEFTAGPITSTLTATNAKADTVFTNFALLHGYDGDINDKQAVADFSMAELRIVLTGGSRQYQNQVDAQAAKDAVAIDPDLAFE